MAILHENYSLKPYNTFGIKAKADYFFEFDTIDEIKSFLDDNPLDNVKYLILGGGSNLLFTDDYDGLVLHPNIKGIEIVSDNKDSVLVKAGANEDWDELVAWAVTNGYGGIENLSNIPGVVGAVPVQNIGAYGVEASQVVEKLDAISIESKRQVEFQNFHCEFDYRDSVFKKEYKNLFIITYVYFRLSKKPEFNLEYGAISKELESYDDINLKNIREVIIKIRESKLPDPKVIGNAGSFFKNPIVDTRFAEQLLSKHPDCPNYEVDNTNTKLAAGWLIEQCGWKGKQVGQAGVHKDQALVLVNLGDAKGYEVLQLANDIKKSVLLKYGVKLEMEVNAI
ncbi:UDP-N-acetylmuramate dehydrogenase [Ancylomarina euxinus]|uniref:UDP-N-acetylenolpyruvoylglucosamine reductase n=1 Tax=Ancylomarina euxinus TaxID=2283627 RepID=A0A425XZF9_9BACT|nr:UDP-N-acetylmuramate dehydrogenase [Ancylomarina euxinus]MCZ4694812.1 UDP-N-acetylmuramate dehydrogenase [Ancylomarina euxinus]MUP15886.1 UDP-N-acetylmuramate dehydrogenase [Ancylomarina euxinus]RRG20523.1 UDP-N-acetylmuramate dehydrogenase [Ancylomarina euxinus]